MIVARINKESEYELANWNANEFQSSLQLTIKSTDLNQVRQDFYHIEILEVFQENYNVATYTSLDTFSEISYVGAIFDEYTKSFTECVKIQLTKTNIVDQVQRLDEQINPVIDTESMTLDEYKSYKIQILSATVSQCIYSGNSVVLHDGVIESFSFDDHDQIDLIALCHLAMMNPSLELPWHSNGNECRFYSGYDIIIIYETLYMKLMKEVTTYNAIHQLILKATSKEEVDKYYYGCTLPEEVQSRVDGMVSKMVATVMEILEKFKPKEDEEPSEETSEESEESEESTDETSELTNE